VRTIAAPGTKLKLTRFILPPRPTSCRERGIWHETPDCNSKPVRTWPFVILQKTNIPVDVVLSEIGGGSQRRSGRSLSRARASVHRRLGGHCELAK
jgi:hypothetical protein